MSLLLGIDEEKKEIACGLVDTIGIRLFSLRGNHTQKDDLGSFTFAKTLEYKAKQGIQSGKEVTVMPPAEYQQRFVNALDGYFVACPGQCIVSAMTFGTNRWYRQVVQANGWRVQDYQRHESSSKRFVRCWKMIYVIKTSCITLSVVLLDF